MKVIIQIPCKNESAHLAEVIRDLPSTLPGIESVETLVIDDGSTDETTRTAVELGVHHVLRFEVNRGLAKTFETGLRFSRLLGADVIVNTDGDNQYQAAYIAHLVRELLSTNAGIVVGARPISEIEHFSWLKKKLQRWGSYFVGQLSGYPVADAPSGFRALSKHAASKLTIHSRYTYTLETLVQAPIRGIQVHFVPIGTNPKIRQSRLMRSTLQYLLVTARSLVVIVLLYKPYLIGILATFVGLPMLGLSILAYSANPILFGQLMILGFLTLFGGWAFALLAQMQWAGRVQAEEEFFFQEREMSPEEGARRLGASAYYHNGKPVFRGDQRKL